MNALCRGEGCNGCMLGCSRLMTVSVLGGGGCNGCMLDCSRLMTVLGGGGVRAVCWVVAG